MQEAVSAILDERARGAGGLNGMLAMSLAAHAVLVAGVMLSPAEWWRGRVAPDSSAMVISLGGVDGPDVGGMTSIAERAVQSIAKPDAPKAIETPPAAKPPEMVESVAKPTPKAAEVKRPDETSRSRRPTAGVEIKAGAAPVVTGGAAVPFGGLASQSGGGGDGVKLDVGNFCCPDYIVRMRQLIHRNWNPNQGAVGQPVVKFTIRRDGMLTQVELSQSSGQALLDIEARRAVLNTRQLPALPAEFDGPHLTVHLTFEFKR